MRMGCRHAPVPVLSPSLHEVHMTQTSDIQALLDRENIREVIQRSCRALDRADLELFRSCYHEDAWDDHGYYKGPVANFTPSAIARAPHVKNVMHNITTVLIDLQGDRAWTEAYYVAYLRTSQDGVEKDITFGGRYVDRFERRNGEWKIAHRLTVYDWSRVDVVEETFTIPGGVQGSASRDDPSYDRSWP
jgi:hypothetical protein